MEYSGVTFTLMSVSEALLVANTRPGKGQVTVQARDSGSATLKFVVHL